MKTIRPSDKGGRYAKGILSAGVFTPEQSRYLEEELEKLVAVIANHDEGYYPRWEDLRFPFTQSKRGALDKPDFDYTNIGLLFPQNDTSEAIYVVAQMPHGYLEGSELRPHIHWQQTGASFPTWTMEYKWFNNGSAVPASFTTISTSTGVFPYVSGNLAQISAFAEIDGAGMGLSSILLIKFYRNDNVVSGDVLGFELDIHYRSDDPGTITEFE